MTTSDLATQLNNCWQELYPDYSNDLLTNFIEDLKQLKTKMPSPDPESTWYKDAVVYSLYVDLFNIDFPGLIKKLDYLCDLGITCIWLLPILDSPMKDAGFDICDFKNIRKELAGTDLDANPLSRFLEFVKQAHSRKIKVIFDIAVNHTSDEHPWFISAVNEQQSPYEDYYIFNNTDQRYQSARLLFKGMCDSNWEKCGDRYYFHRFFENQPDLNYHNPEVLFEMCRSLIFWMEKGIDGFRLDAIPFLWKSEGTDCENLPQTHTLLRFIRAIVDYLRRGTLLLAEACQPPSNVIQYFGYGDECHAAYHFPLMPQIFRALAEQKRDPIIRVLDPSVTPPKPPDCQWMLFLRCHDELTLEMVSDEERDLLNRHYRQKDHWSFRKGEGISARLSELLGKDPEKIRLAFSILLSLPGSPIIYYGDEFGKLNDEDYYREQMEKSGYADSRNLCRGSIHWEKVQVCLNNPESFESGIFQSLKKMLNVRQKYPTFGRGEMTWIDFKDQNNRPAPAILAYLRNDEANRILIINNLSAKPVQVKPKALKINKTPSDLLQQTVSRDSKTDLLSIPGYGNRWILLSD
jgi:maltose alpha-D-glucosyltransferase / alpha-amylase